MRERFIVAPGLDGNELSKSLARFGKNIFGQRVIGTTELARIGLMRSGIALKEEYVDSRERLRYVSRAVKTEPWFGDPTYTDIMNIAEAIDALRLQLRVKEDPETLLLGKGGFDDKNRALLNVVRKYELELAKENKIDSAGLIIKAGIEAEPMDADIVGMFDVQMSFREVFLLANLSGGDLGHTDLLSLFGAPMSGGIKVESYSKCYGAPNEAEHIIEKILQSGSLDRSVIAVTDPAMYSSIFFDLMLLYDIPMTFGCGVPISCSNPGRLLKLYYEWMSDGCFRGDRLLALIGSSAFDRAVLKERLPEYYDGFNFRRWREVLSNLRLTNDPEINRTRIADYRKAVKTELGLTDPNEESYKDVNIKVSFIPYLEVLAEELALLPEEFISRYARKRTDREILRALDTAAVTSIGREIRAMRESEVRQDPSDSVSYVMGLRVCSMQSMPGSIHITDMDGALCTIRDELYIAGLSARKFPGMPKEDYLLLDSDIRNYTTSAYMADSKERVRERLAETRILGRLCTFLGTRIHLSYAGMDVSELKKDNPSSIIFEFYREEHDKVLSTDELDDIMEKIGYFDPKIPGSRLVGKAYSEGCGIVAQKITELSGVKAEGLMEKAYSPSALNTFFECPRRFMLSSIVGIKIPEEDDPYETIAGNAAGTLAHSLMEKLQGSGMSREDFLSLSGRLFDCYVMEDPPLISDVSQEKEAFLEMMDAAYVLSPEGDAEYKETTLTCKHETGIILHGIPDCVAVNPDGTYTVIDYKTYNSIRHIENDIDTCLQGVIYAYILEHANDCKVAGIEFRYLKYGRTVKCAYDDEMKIKLKEKLEVFKAALEDGTFEPDPGEGEVNCRYCKFARICGKTEGQSDD